MSRPPDTAVCIFAKAPRAGEVKTRLAATIGAECATRLAIAFFADTLALARQLTSARVIVALAGDPSALPPGYDAMEVWPQGDGDLGARLERVLARALTVAPAAIALGTDSPGLPLRLIQQARSSLKMHDAVVGLADDGGFYLLGLRACPTGILHGLPWSVSETGARTVERLHSHQLKVDLLPHWFDVDTVGELERLRALLLAGEIVAPATEAALREVPLGVAR